MSDVFAIFVLVVGVIGLAAILWAVRSGKADRQAEDDARSFFAEHGRWPDETEEEAEERRDRSAAAAQAAEAQHHLAHPDDEGRV